MPKNEHWSGNFSVTKYLCIHQPKALTNGLGNVRKTLMHGWCDLFFRGGRRFWDSLSGNLLSRGIASRDRAFSWLPARRVAFWLFSSRTMPEVEIRFSPEQVCYRIFSLSRAVTRSMQMIELIARG
jgi:hypothetical protein